MEDEKDDVQDEGIKLSIVSDSLADNGGQVREDEPFISHTEGEQPAQMDPAASLASFRDDVYQSTTAPLNEPADKANSCSCCHTCCKVCSAACYTRVKPCMWRYSTRPSASDSWGRKLRYAWMCPPHGLVAKFLLVLVAILLGFGLVWSVTGEEGLPGGTFFGLFILFLLCSAMGLLMPPLKLPPLLGMLVMGCILGNVPYINVAKGIAPAWSSAIRKVALAVILTRAGLGLDPQALKRMSCVVLRLAFSPCVIEALACMCTSHFLLGLPLVWGLMLGFVLAAVSPAVVVPSLLSLSDRGFGVDQGVPTLVIAAASLDDVLAISAFSILLSVAFSDTGNIGLTVVKGPLEALAGMLYGVVVGVVVWYLPAHHSTTHLDLKRSVILLCGGLLALFGSAACGIDGAGALGSLTLPFVAALRWRKQLPQGQTELPTEAHMGYLWALAQPFLFGLIGAAVDFQQIEAKAIGMGLAVLLIGLLFRLLASFLAVFGAGFTIKEKLFIPLAWLPKATVQALIGSTAYDTALERKAGQEKEDWGMQILTIAVLCILVTAPVGAALIGLSGPRLLQKTTKQTCPPQQNVKDTSAGKSEDAITADTSV